MDLELYRIITNKTASKYVSDSTDHLGLYRRLLRTGVSQRITIYKLRNNYHLGIL